MTKKTTTQPTKTDKAVPSKKFTVITKVNTDLRMASYHKPAVRTRLHFQASRGPPLGASSRPTISSYFSTICPTVTLKTWIHSLRFWKRDRRKERWRGGQGRKVMVTSSKPACHLVTQYLPVTRDLLCILLPQGARQRNQVRKVRNKNYNKTQGYS